MKVVAFALLLLSSAAHAECNCVAYAIGALSSIHVHLKTIPAVAQNDWCERARPGCYRRGVVFIKSVDDCRTMIHEFVHHSQWLKYGDALDRNENWRREMQAAHLTAIAMIETECK